MVCFPTFTASWANFVAPSDHSKKGGSLKFFWSIAGVWFLPGIVVGGWTRLRKLLLDVVDVQGGVFAHSLVACDISTRLATSCLISAGAMPERRCRLFMLLGFKQPVIKRQVLFNAGSSFLAWVDPSQTGHACSAEEYHRAEAVCCSSPFGVSQFPGDVVFSLVFMICSLKERVRSRVTPR